MTPFLVALSLLSAPALIQEDSAQEAPAVFRDLDWNAAKAEAHAEGRMLLLDAMTGWCGPCKIMDATTWVDPDVVTWLKGHAVPVQFDMDQHEALKDQLGIAAFPTMILFRSDGTEFDRLVGLRKPAEMVAWLEGARTGQTERDRLLQDVARVEAHDRPAIAARAALAAACASSGAPEESARLAGWLWQRRPADSSEATALTRWRTQAGRNLSTQLAAKDKAFAALLRQQRDARGADLAREESTATRTEWIVLNWVIGDEASSLIWATEAASRDADVQGLRAHADRLFDPLVDAGLWSTAGIALSNPLDRVRFLGENLGAYDVARTPAKNTKPGAIPAIPMGGMATARPASQTKASTPPKVIPAIPLGGMTPARPAGVDEELNEVIPAIPMGGGKPARDTGETPGAAVPMIPMGAPPKASMARTHELSKEAAVAREVRQRLTHELRRVASRRYGALLAAGREAEAEAVGLALIGYADGPEARAQLVSAAIRAGRFEARRELHLRWLDEAARVR